jgi:hypothetical protein
MFVIVQYYCSVDGQWNIFIYGPFADWTTAQSNLINLTNKFNGQQNNSGCSIASVQPRPVPAVAKPPSPTAVTVGAILVAKAVIGATGDREVFVYQPNTLGGDALSGANGFVSQTAAWQAMGQLVDPSGCEVATLQAVPTIS